MDRIGALAILASVAFMPFASQAASVLDREYVAAGNNTLVISSNQPLAQSFSVGLDGLLDRVEVQLFRTDTSLTGTLTLSILEVTGGALGSVLTSVTRAVSDLPTAAEFLSFDFADLDVDLGDTLAIRLTVDQPGGGNCTPACWRGDFPGLFDGGIGFAFDVPNERDFGFRTFIETATIAVPEPSALGLAAVALAGIAFARRRAPVVMRRVARGGIKAAALALAMLPTVARVQAAPLLDQEFVAFSAGFRFSSTIPLTQSFTVGRDGLLDRVEAQIFRDPSSSAGTITMSVLDFSGGTFGAVLGSATLAVSALPADMNGSFVSFDFADFDVDIGDQLAIRFTSDTPNGFSCTPACWLGESPGDYEGGAGFVQDTETIIDFGFRTFVDDLVDVPEPSTLALLGAGVLMLSGRSRARR